MNLSIVSLAIITVFGGPSPNTYAQNCMDPNDPNCINNNPITNTWISQVYGTNDLQWSVINQTNFYLFNTILHHLYEIQKSTNLIDWSILVPSFTNLGTSTIVLNLTNENEFLRAKEVTYQLVSTNVHAEIGNPANCIGSYIGHARFHPPFYYINTNTLLHTISDLSSRTNVKIQVVGVSGDTYCGTNSITVSGYSPAYLIDLYFSNDLPNTNVPYTISLGGFQ